MSKHTVSNSLRVIQDPLRIAENISKDSLNQIYFDNNI
jgi:hypothetical protein